MKNNKHIATLTQNNKTYKYYESINYDEVQVIRSDGKENHSYDYDILTDDLNDNAKIIYMSQAYLNIYNDNPDELLNLQALTNLYGYLKELDNE